MVMVGAEFHQRLDTHKLFCECPYLLIEGQEPDVRITRRLHTVLSELGEVDEASKQEFAKGKTYEYYAYGKTNCMVEIDEEPPHEINKNALAIGLHIASQLYSKPVDEVHIMRKIIIDGSITSGFQRTAVISLGGYLETSKGKVRITQLSLEEESAGIVEAGKSIFKLDRMGIPLIEITTEPDIKDAEHLSEVAEKIGLLMRATGKVARGLGTIRQDLNVSIEGGARVEIKGAQDLKLLPTLLSEEVKRQENLIAITNELKKMPQPTEIAMLIYDLTEIFKNTNSKLIKNGIETGQKVFGLNLHGFAGFLGRTIQTGRRFGTELSEYAKTAGVKGIFHSDEDLNKYNISINEAEQVRKKLNTQKQDAFVLVVAPEIVGRNALRNVKFRAGMRDIPKETRKANPDGTTSYMRPLAGKARLYPETDIPPIEITEGMVKKVGKGESVNDKRQKLVGLLKNKDMVERVLKSRNLSLFEKLVEEGNEPMLVANTLENTLVSLRREGVELKDSEALHEIFEEHRKGKFVKAAIPEVIKGIVKTGKKISEIVEENQLERITGKELEKIAKELNYDFSKIMQKYRLRIEALDLTGIKSN